MIIFKQIPGYFKGFFKSFKKIFSKPRLGNSKRLVSGLVLSDRKNIQEISSIYGDKDQSSLNRFATESDWSLKEANQIRLNLANRILGSKKEGIIIFDDTIAVKTGKKMEKYVILRAGEVLKVYEANGAFVMQKNRIRHSAAPSRLTTLTTIQLLMSTTASTTLRAAFSGYAPRGAPRCEIFHRKYRA